MTTSILVPFAAITWEASEDEEPPSIENALAYLFWDAKQEAVVWATTDDWDRSNTLESFDVLGVVLN